MASITIRKLDETTKKKLRVRAAQRGHSMEEEVRHIIKTALKDRSPTGESLFAAIRRHVEPVGGLELEIPVRSKRVRAPLRLRK